MTQDEARHKFWELKHEIDAAKKLRQPFNDERNAVAIDEEKLRDKIKAIIARREKAFDVNKLGSMEMELSALARYLNRQVGVDPFLSGTPKGVTEH